MTTVVVLEDATEDLESGAQFYESCAPGVGDYFLDSILSDLDSLILFAGVHPIYFGFHRMPSRRFPFGIYRTAFLVAPDRPFALYKFRNLFMTDFCFRRFQYPTILVIVAVFQRNNR